MSPRVKEWGPSPTLQEVADEIRKRLDEGEIDALDVEVLSEHLAVKVKGEMADMGLDLVKYRRLAGIDTIEKRRASFIPKIATLEEDFRAIGLIGDEVKSMTHGMTQSVEYYGISSLMDTKVQSGDPYRDAGKKTIEEVLKEASLEHEFLIKVPEEVTEEQRRLMDRLEASHSNIRFINTELVALIEIPAKKPNAFVRLWRMLSHLWS